MDASMSLISAQISFFEGRLALIHIPLELYSFFLQPILRLLFGEDHDEDASKIPWTDRHKFLNVSITPVECSVVCAREFAERYFRPLAKIWNARATNERDRVMISSDEFVVVQVEGQGLDAGQRVLELTRPLAMAGISIFFKTTYFSDYILVPAKSTSAVTQALEQRGFTFSADVSAFMHQSQISPPSSNSKRHSPSESIHSLDGPFQTTHQTPPSTPPATNVYDLQNRTFSRLRKNNITPLVDQDIRLISCAGRKDDTPDNQAKLKNDLLQCLISTCPCAPNGDADDFIPDNSIKFLSLTMTDAEPISLFIESRFVSHSGAVDKHPNSTHTLHNLATNLLGSRETDDYLIPVTLDLRDLPLEATGIVCGVAATLSHDSEQQDSPSAVEISFLSTAKAGTVLVRENDLERAVRALERGFGRSQEEAAAMTNGEAGHTP